MAPQLPPLPRGRLSATLRHLQPAPTPAAATLSKFGSMERDAELAQLPEPEPGVRMLYLIKQRPESTREQLVANWFSNHMPGVIAALGPGGTAEQAGRPHTTRYHATLLDPTFEREGERVWDGYASLHYAEEQPNGPIPHGTTPSDTFQQHANPYVGWALQEQILLDNSSAGGVERLPTNPNTLNDPWPATRGCFYKVVVMVKAQPGTGFDSAFDELRGAAMSAQNNFPRAGGSFKTSLNLSLHPEEEEYCALVELYFADEWSQQATTLGTAMNMRAVRLRLAPQINAHLSPACC